MKSAIIISSIHLIEITPDPASPFILISFTLGSITYTSVCSLNCSYISLLQWYTEMHPKFPLKSTKTNFLSNVSSKTEHIGYAGTSPFFDTVLVTLHDSRTPLLDPRFRSPRLFISYFFSPRCFGWVFRIHGMFFMAISSFLDFILP